MSSSGGNSPSLPSHGSVGLIFGSAAPFTGAVDPRPNERSLENDGTKSVFGKELYVFRTDLLSIIRSLNTVFTVIGICHTVMLSVCKRGRDGAATKQSP